MPRLDRAKNAKGILISDFKTFNPDFLLYFV